MNPNNIRRKIVDFAIASGEGHIASSFSIVEILIAIHKASSLYSSFSANNMILSKGHASYAYYAMLSEIALMSEQETSTIGKIGSKFYGHLPYIQNDTRFQFGSGSLGHGLPYAVGVGVGRMLRDINSPLYCIVGDGEANEGTFWESLLIMQKFRLKNLNILIDANGSSERALPITNTLKSLAPAFPTFEFYACNGHDPVSIAALMTAGSSAKIIVCETIKGFPIPFMIGDPSWHHKIPTEEERRRICEVLR